MLKSDKNLKINSTHIDMNKNSGVYKNIALFSKNKQDNIVHETRIQCNDQEYSVTKINDLFLVKPCGSKSRDFPSTMNKSVSNPIQSNNTNVNLQSSKLQIRSSDKGGLQASRYLNSNVSLNSAKTVPLCSTETKSIKTRFLDAKSREYLNQIYEAIKLQKVFILSDVVKKNSSSPLKNSLKARGWIERSLSNLPDEEITNPKMVEYMRNILKDAPANFVWVVSSLDFSSVNCSTIVSRFPKNTHFTNKVGLCYMLEQFHWFYDPNVSQTITPRTFKITRDDDINDFNIQYVMTACVSLLKTIVEQIANAESDYFFRDGEVPITIMDFANTQCSEYILSKQHDDIDYKVDHQIAVEDYTEFLSWFHKIIYENGRFQTTPFPTIEALYAMSKVTLKNIKPFWPQLEVEGEKNLWIVKPSDRFCGNGVIVMNNLESIIKYIKERLERQKKHSIVQKYIENPLLIYGTKFDIRQWFLITSVFPLVIWFYKECYLRFSSQLFSLINLHNSVHLTNNSVQRNYTNDRSRHPKLPKENMWHSSTFQSYLRDINEPDKWNKVILPGMKQSIVGAVLASQDELIDRPNSFELYGADFLLGSDYTPILLEINQGPDLSPSTSVTADLCHRCIEDIMKVVLDRRKNWSANTGQFEVLYQQAMGPRHQTVGLDLTLTSSKTTDLKQINKANK